MAGENRAAAVLAAISLAWPVAVRAEPVTSDWIPRWRADLAYAADSLPRTHPNFFHSVSEGEYRGALDSLAARVPRLAQHQIVVELARIVAMVGDGHTRLTLPFDDAAGFFTGHTSTAKPNIPNLTFRHYPIRFGLFGDTLRVVRTDEAHRNLLGGRVLRLGRMTATEAAVAVEPCVQRDNESQVRNLLPTWLVCPEILEARGVVGDMERAAILVEQDTGTRVEGTLTPQPPGVAVAWLDAQDPNARPLRDRRPERSHWFVRIPGTRHFYARYREVKDDEKETVAQFADSLFATMEEAGADRLVIDLRGNVGGNGFLNRPLVQHLIRAERLWTPGGLWALIDRGTFSAAVMLAADLEQRTPALLVGEKTGGHPNSYGDSKRRLLPNTGLTVRVSSLYWQLTGPTDSRNGIAPLIPVEESFADWRAGRDKALETALASDGPPSGLAGSWNGEIGWQADRAALGLRLKPSDAGWSGRIDLSDGGLKDAPLAEPRVKASRVTAGWAMGSERCDFQGRLVGAWLVGLMRYKGLDFPVALRKSGRPDR